MSSITIPILQLKNTDTPLVDETVISQTGFSTGINTLPFQALYNLNQALQALDPAPNATTVQFNDSILLTNGGVFQTTLNNGYITVNDTTPFSSKTAQITPSQVQVVDTTNGEQANLTLNGLSFLGSTSAKTITATGGYDITVSSDNQVILTSSDNVNINAGVGLLITASDYISMTANNDNIVFNADDEITLNSVGLKAVNLNAPNVDSYSYAMPICFTRERSGDSFNYNAGGQSWENVKDFQLNVPYQFFTDTPQVGYTSTKWKIDFALNCYANSNIGDKGLALYVDFYDNTIANFISPIAYNLTTPYAVFQTASSFSNASQPPFQNFNWSDLIDFAVLSGTGSGNVPLTMRLWVAGDNPFSCQFNMVVSLTRTNQI